MAHLGKWKWRHRVKDSFRPLGKTQWHFIPDQGFLSFFFATGYNFNWGKFSDFVCFCGPQICMAIQGSVISLTSSWLKQISPLAVSPFCLWLQCMTVDSCAYSGCWAEVAVWFGPPLPRKKKEGLLGQVWLQPCLWPASGQGRVCALSVQSMNGTCTQVAARGQLWAAFIATFYTVILEKDSYPSSHADTSFAWVYAFL